ncbi:MAG: hypothetical protein K2N22_03965 [Clostridia bacterium]|nr:hypothetical protein [Clostridia bacterium]
MIKIDVVCPLYQADGYIENLIDNIKMQDGVILDNVVFAITEIGDTSFVKEKILEAGFSFFSVEKEDFSHSLTRQKAVFEYCSSDVVIMISQDVVLCQSDAFYELAKNVNSRVVYAYGKQICRKKNIEYYIRKKNYGEKTEFVSAEDIDRLQLKAFFASDAFAAYYRPVFIELNGYDDIPMMMSEDMYYSKKILEAGYQKGYIATAVVEHSHKFSLKQLYNRYYQTGIWFREHPEFDNYKTTDTGLKLAFYVLGQALKHFNIPVLFRWLPDMTARYLGMKKGKKIVKK